MDVWSSVSGWSHSSRQDEIPASFPKVPTLLWLLREHDLCCIRMTWKTIITMLQIWKIVQQLQLEYRLQIRASKALLFNDALCEVNYHVQHRLLITQAGFLRLCFLDFSLNLIFSHLRPTHSNVSDVTNILSTHLLCLELKWWLLPLAPLSGTSAFHWPGLIPHKSKQRSNHTPGLG